MDLAHKKARNLTKNQPSFINQGNQKVYRAKWRMYGIDNSVHAPLS